MPQAHNTLVHHMWTLNATMYYMEPWGDAQLHIIISSDLMDEAISYTMFMFTFTL